MGTASWIAITTILIPLLIFGVKAVSGRKLDRVFPYISVVGAFLSLLLSSCVLWIVATGKPEYFSFPWLTINSLSISLGVYLDKLSSLMLLVVFIVSFCIQFFSLSYMSGDRRIEQYYAFLSLFAFSMGGLVISSNLLITFIFWELVGLCSYLLIGFWYEREQANRAAVKALIVTKIGDVGFLLGLVFLLKETGTLDILELPHVAAAPVVFSTAAILLFMGAVGKSAQFPLHVWLPDAMEGPTPVSALIHAATMVAAGVYLIVRVQYLFAGVQPRMLVLAIGLVTALMAALIAMFQKDIKRVLAYSTISQLGYMMVALGVGAFSVGMFHLTTHAFFKALLFLAAGSVFHAAHSLNIFDLGGLVRKMPATMVFFLVGALSLGGFPGTGGFFSKDSVLSAVGIAVGDWVYWALVIGAFLSSFYIFRVFFRAFFGDPGKAYEEVHESDWKILAPMGLLAVMSFIVGIIAFSDVFAPAATGSFELKNLLKSSLVSASGILLAWLMYGAPRREMEKIKNKAFSFAYDVLYNRLYIDEFYELVFLSTYKAISTLSRWIDEKVIDGFVKGVAFSSLNIGDRVRRVQNGALQFYVAASLLVVVIMGYFYLFAGWGGE